MHIEKKAKGGFKQAQNSSISPGWHENIFERSFLKKLAMTPPAPSFTKIS